MIYIDTEKIQSAWRLLGHIKIGTDSVHVKGDVQR